MKFQKMEKRIYLEYLGLSVILYNKFLETRKTKKGSKSMKIHHMNRKNSKKLKPISKTIPSYTT